MKYILLFLSLFSLILSGCKNVGAPISTPTISMTFTATDTPSPSLTSTPTFTLTPTNTPTPTISPSITPTPIHPVGVLVEHEPTEEFIYKWYSYVPEGLSKDQTIYILVTGINGGTYDYEESAITVESMLKGRMTWPQIDRFVLLAPVIPRRESPHVYPVAFDLNSFHESDVFYNRSDIKVNAIIDLLLDTLREDGYQVSPKVMIEGFSSGGMFAQRYSLLHPERVKAIAAGHCGGNFTLPFSEFNSQLLTWPVGVNNLDALAGIEFDQDSYKNIHQYIFIGENDTGEGGTTIVWNRLHPTWGPQYMWESVSQMEFLHNNFGETDPIRLQNQVNYLNGVGFVNINFKMYPGVPHSITDQMIDDFMEFLAEQAKE